MRGVRRLVLDGCTFISIVKGKACRRVASTVVKGMNEFKTGTAEFMTLCSFATLRKLLYLLIIHFYVYKIEKMVTTLQGVRNTWKIYVE